MNKLILASLFALIAVSSASNLRREDLAAGVGAKLVNVTVIGPNVNGSMLSFTTGQVLNASNTFNLTGNTCFKTSNAVKNSMEKKYGGTWGVDCLQAAMGYDYYTFVNGYNIQMQIANNNQTFFFLIFQANTNAPNATMLVEQDNFVDEAWEMLGAFFVKVLYQGNGVNSDMRNNLINFAVQGASNYNLDITKSGNCFHCAETAQSISLNANFAYRDQWQTEILINAPQGTEYGAAAITVQQGRALSLLVNSNGNVFKIYIASIRT